ncbi:hypothetical protein [uncultured Hoeflea sp.]|uniref:hypothetical protein n=1 Tax=uncultured Hoeflea sp. TaxID=538666 RepID=UPI0030EC0C9B|tara:strand:- start:12345 stop:13769 length:1425 start_codon:yes stop_codon:yes gene_type:complete
MIDLTSEIDAWHHSHRRPAEIDYIKIIKDNIPQVFDKNFGSLEGFSISRKSLTGFASALMSYYHSESGFSTNKWSVTEHGGGSRGRHLFIDTKPFCAGINTPLPKRNCHNQILNFDTSDKFLSKIKSALLIFDQIAIIDPCPKIFKWAEHDSYLYSNAAGIKGDAYKLRYEAIKPLDFDNPIIDEITPEEIDTLKIWFEFCRDFSDFFAENRIFSVPDRYPDWLISYSSGSESDKPKFGDFNRILSSTIGPFSDPMFVRFQDRDWGEDNSKELLDRVFWQSHFLGNGAISIDSLSRADWLLSELGGLKSKAGELTDASLSVSSYIFHLRYGLKLDGISPSELKSISSSDEIVNELKNIVQDVGDLALLDSITVEEDVAVLKQRFERFEDHLADLRKGSNFYSGVFVPSRDAGLAAVGASASTFMAAGEAGTIMWAGLGAVFPLVVMLPFYGTKAVSKAKVSARAKTLLTQLSAR